MSRPKHSKKEIEEALKHAESQGWTIKPSGGHCWGKIYCPYNNDECRCGEFCITSVWCTPKNAGNHAAQLYRVVNNCSSHRAKIKAQQDMAEAEE
jgi:hypothetical protein